VRLGLKDFLPLGNSGLSGAIRASTARKPILQNSCLMIKQALVLFAFDANIEACPWLIICPIHD
jgi:hypothetical protein